MKEVKEYCLNRLKNVFEYAIIEAKKKNLNDYETIIKFARHINSGIDIFLKENKMDLCVLEPSPYLVDKKTKNLATEISKRIKIPCIFVKSKKKMNTHPCFLIPIDEKVENLKSVNFGIKLAKQMKAKIIFYHTTWKKKGVSSKKLKCHCDERVISNLKIAEEKAKEENIDYKVQIEASKTIEGGIIMSAILNAVDMVIMASSTSLIGGKADLVMMHSLYPLLMIEK